MGRWTIAGIVHEVNGSRAGHDVNGGSESNNSRADYDTNQIVLEVEPELVNVLWVHLRGFDDNDPHERHQAESQEMGHQVMVTQFHVLQVHTLQEVWKSPALVDLNATVVAGFGAHDDGIVSILAPVGRGFG